MSNDDLLATLEYPDQISEMPQNEKSRIYGTSIVVIIDQFIVIILISH